ncbi:hypothetical protein ACCT03_36645, partial [Rhizobium johnstonii]|uniref:hypothetical protein n=1 Tax=Rhizobium johnstonii TaxID=3019933 RepID=UPI003F96A5F8
WPKIGEHLKKPLERTQNWIKLGGKVTFDDDLFASQLSCSHADAGFRGRGLHKISHHLLAGLKANMITAPPRR